MTIAFADIIKPLSKAAVLSDLYAIGQALGLTTTAFQPGEPVPVVLDVVTSWAVDKLWNPWIVPALRGVYLDYSTGNWLALEAWSRYFRPKIESQAGTGPIVLENRGSFFGTLAAGQVRIKSTPTGKTYTNTTVGSLSAWAGGMAPYPTVSLTFQADEDGTASNAQPGDIAAYPTPLVAGPANVFARTNAGPILGSDEEADDRLVTRCRSAAAELSSSGPRAAYVGACMDPIGSFTRRGLLPPTSWGTAAPAITRVRVVDAGNSNTHVFLASDSGPAAGDMGTAGTDVFKAHVALNLFIVPPGVTESTLAASPNDQNLGAITLYIDAAANVSADDAAAGANLSIAYFFSRLAIGGARKVGGGTGYLFAEAVKEVAGSWPQPIPGDPSGNVYYPKIPGLLTVDAPSLADVALGVGDVVIPSWTLAVQIVDQS